MNIILEIIADWKPQLETDGCWAAAIRNLWKDEAGIDFWPKFSTRLNESFIENKFKEFLENKFKYQKVSGNEILEFHSIEKHVSKPNNLPLIYAFTYKGGDSGHFVNIIGTRKNDIIDELHNKWLLIYDPKPDGKGSRYLKNYYTYANFTINQLKFQWTFFDFIPIHSFLQFHDFHKTEKFNFTGTIKKDTLLKNVFDIISNNEIFIDFVGKDPKPNNLFGVRIKKLINDITETNSVSVQTQLSTIENEDSFLVFPIVQNEFKSGVVLQPVDNHTFIIDRIEDISNFKSLKRHVELKQTWITLQNESRNNEVSTMLENYILIEKNNAFFALRDEEKNILLINY